jgi:hypothetical protein
MTGSNMALMAGPAFTRDKDCAMAEPLFPNLIPNLIDARNARRRGRSLGRRQSA